MRTIHKYPVKLNSTPGHPRITIEMPEDACVLTVQTQYAGDLEREMPCVWAMVDTTRPMKKHGFYLFGTGHQMETSGTTRYIGSFQLEGGRFVFHLFEEDEDLYRRKIKPV